MRQKTGALLIASGILLVLISSTEISSHDSGMGGVVLIGPVPIVFAPVQKWPSHPWFLALR